MTIHLNIEMTDRCNIRCIMCGQYFNAPTIHPSSEHYIKPETWKRAIRGLEDIGEDIHLCPHWLGEPTIHPDFDELLDWTFRENIGNRYFREFKLHTNGILLNEKRIEHLLDLSSLPFLKEGTFRYIHFAIDAFSRETYNRIKGGDFRDLVYNNIETLLSMRERRKQHFPLVTLCFVVMPENRGEAREFLSYWKDKIESYGRVARVVWDWPSEPYDSIYLRRLNQKDQKSATLLHREVLRELNLIGEGEEPLLVSESF